MTNFAHDLPMDRLLAHQEWVRKLAVRLVHSPDLADDVAQNVWLRVLQTRPPAEGKERAWLAEVARNEARQSFRSDAARRRRESRQQPQPLPDAALLAERAEVAQRLLREVLALPDRYRDILLYRFFEGLRPAELARRSGRPITTVRSEVDARWVRFDVGSKCVGRSETRHGRSRCSPCYDGRPPLRHPRVRPPRRRPCAPRLQGGASLSRSSSALAARLRCSSWRRRWERSGTMGAIEGPALRPLSRRTLGRLDRVGAVSP